MQAVPSNQDALSASPADPFAVRHPFLIHAILVILCWLTYLLDREDVVWRFIKESAKAHQLEHLAFALAAVCIGLGVWLGAWPSGNRDEYAGQASRSIRRRSMGEILHAVGIASLLPLAGSVALVCTETVRSMVYAHSQIVRSAHQTRAHGIEINADRNPLLRRIFFRHIAGVCAFFSMLAFSITLRDRLADGLFAATALVFVVSRFIAPG
jgi:hypothetical protein